MDTSPERQETPRMSSKLDAAADTARAPISARVNALEQVDSNKPNAVVGRRNAVNSLFQPAQTTWAGVGGALSWLAAHTFVPEWLPKRVRHPLTGYLAAVVLALLAVELTAALLVLDPDYRFAGLVIVLAVALVALTFGMGPSLLLALVGVGLSWFLVFPSQGSPLFEDIGDAVALALLTTFALLMGIFISRTKQAQLEAEAATRVRDRFMSLASHELRTPLTTIKLGAQLVERRVVRVIRLTDAAHERTHDRASDLARGLAPDLATLATLVTQIETAVARQDRLVIELLDVSRIQTGQLTYEMAPCDLAVVAQRAIEEQRQQHPDRDIRLDILDIGDAPDHTPAYTITVLADAQRIEQVITNYLTNALKYSRSDQPVEVNLSVDSGAARVAVCDHGPGLTADEQAEVWELYHRTQGIEVVSGSGVGLGLGLFLCRSIVQAHRGGAVGVDSEKGAGCAFWFTLPLLQDSPAHGYS